MPKPREERVITVETEPTKVEGVVFEKRLGARSLGENTFALIFAEDGGRVGCFSAVDVYGYSSHLEMWFYDHWQELKGRLSKEALDLIHGSWFVLFCKADYPGRRFPSRQTGPLKTLVPLVMNEAIVEMKGISGVKQHAETMLWGFSLVPTFPLEELQARLAHEELTIAEFLALLQAWGDGLRRVRRGERFPAPQPQRGPVMRRHKQPNLSFDTEEDVLRYFRGVNALLDELHEPVIEEVKHSLVGLKDRSFGSFKANQSVAIELQRTLNRLGLRVECPRDGCQQPAVLQVRPAPRMPDGTFQFEHALNGRHTIHAGRKVLPTLTLVKAAADRRRKIHQE